MMKRQVMTIAMFVCWLPAASAWAMADVPPDVQKGYSYGDLGNPEDYQEHRLGPTLSGAGKMPAESEQSSAGLVATEAELPPGWTRPRTRCSAGTARTRTFSSAS